MVSVTEKTGGKEAQHDSQVIALVVDDDANIRVLTARILAPYVMRVDTAEDADEAKKIILGQGRRDYNLVITDQEMPGLPGNLLARLVKMEIRGVAVVLTSGSHEALEEEAQDPNSRVDYFLPKPPEPGALEDIVRQVDLKLKERVR